MANADNPKGFQIMGRNAVGGNIQAVMRKKDVLEATALYPGDAVAREDDGGIGRGITPGTTLISGVNQTYAATLTASEHLVVVDPYALFRAQADGALAEADMGLNTNIIVGTGSATLRQSRDEVNSAAEAVTATLDVHLLDKVNAPDNDWGAYVELVVMFNKHRLAHDQVGV